MSDVRGIPKRSKTVVFIVVFVFFQVLALAIVGLLALRESRDAEAQDARDRVAQHGRDALSGFRDRAISAVKRALTAARQVKSFQALQDLRERNPQAIALRILRVDRDGTLWWLDRRHVVYRPYPLVRASFEQSLPRARESAAEARLAGAARHGPGESFARWSSFLRENKLYLGDPSQGVAGGYPYPFAVYYADGMLREYLISAAGSEEQPSPDAIRTGVMQSLEIEVLNRVRVGDEIEPIDVPDTLDRIDGAVDRVLREVSAGLLGRLPAEVRGYRAYRRWIRDDRNRRTLEGVLAGVAEQAAPREQPLLQLQASGELFAISSDVDTLGFTVIELDVGAVSALMQAQFDPSQFEPFGLEIRVTGPGESHEDADGERVHRVDVAGNGLDLPGFEAAVFRVREASPETDGRSELIFWGIIGFAVLGFLFGTWVLVRLITREVRLAQLKADFVGNLSHELKTPLTSIGLFTEMLQDGKLESPEDKAEAYSVLAQESQRLQRIVQRMIDVARKEAQGVAYALGPADLNVVVRDAITRFQRIVTEPGLDLVVNLSPQPLPMMMDVQAMDDVVTNLLSNAWKYKQGNEARILVSTRQRGTRAELVVSDDGIGIPRAERKQVFEMFYRADQYLTQPVSGTGLGLALVRTIVRGHKGNIHVGSGEGGKGTAFRLRFPLDRKAQDVLLSPRFRAQNEEEAPGASTRDPAGTAGHTGAT